MENSKPVTTYRRLGMKIDIYIDRVVVSNLWSKSYHVSEIKGAVVNHMIFGVSGIHLVMNDGTASGQIGLKTPDAESCQKDISKLIDDYIKSSNLGSIVQVKCKILGGHGHKLVKGESCNVSFSEKLVSIESSQTSIKITCDMITGLDIGGPGRVDKHLGLVGGLTDLGDSSIGVGMALPISLSSTDTIINLSWDNAEIFLHTSSHTPEDARIILSHVFSAINKHSTPTLTQSDITSQLERLVTLKDSGHLTADEYAQAKAKLLGLVL